MATGAFPLPWVVDRDGQWHHVTQVVDGAATRVYIDGVRWR
jgi:hypothetical protein